MFGQQPAKNLTEFKSISKDIELLEKIKELLNQRDTEQKYLTKHLEGLPQFKNDQIEADKLKKELETLGGGGSPSNKNDRSNGNITPDRNNNKKKSAETPTSTVVASKKQKKK